MSRHPAIAIIIAALTAFIASCTGSTATAVEKIIIEPESITFAPGETKTVEITILPDNASDKTVIWSDSDAFTIDGASITASSTAQAGDYTLTASSRSNPDIKATLKATISASSAGGGGGGSTTPPTPPEEEPEEELSPDATISKDAIFDSSAAVEGKTNVSEPITIEADKDVIKIEGLTGGKLYTLYPDRGNGVAGSSMNLRARTASSRNSSNLINVNSSGYSYAFIVPEGETSYTFKASDMGLSAGDSFTVGDTAAPTLDFEDGINGMSISQIEDGDIMVSDDGEVKTYEKFFSVSIEDLKTKLKLDPSRLVILGETVEGSGSGGTNFGLIDQFGNDMPVDGTSTILDLSEEKTIYVYTYMEVITEDSPWKFVISFVNPIEVTSEPQSLKAPGAYLLKASSIDRIVEISGGQNNSNLDLEARYGIDGRRHPWFFEISRDPVYLINLESNLTGYENEDIIFSYPIAIYGDATIRVRDAADDDPKPEEINSFDKPYTIVMGETKSYLPIIFRTNDSDKDLGGMNVKVADFRGCRVNVVARHTYGTGSSTMVLEDSSKYQQHETDFDNSDILEYAYIERKGGPQEEIILEFFEYNPSQGGKN